MVGNGRWGVVAGAAAGELTLYAGSNRFYAAATSGISSCGYTDLPEGRGGRKQLAGLTLRLPTEVAEERLRTPWGLLGLRRTAQSDMRAHG